MNEDYIRQHYRFLSHEKQTEIRVIKNDIGENTFLVDNEEAFTKKVVELTQQKKHVCVGTNERRPGERDDDSVISLKLLQLDLDTKDPTQVQLVEDFFKTKNITISAKVFSGQKGYHYYIKVKPITDNFRIREVLANAKYYLIDEHKLPFDPKCFNASRVFRVWGSENEGQTVELLHYDDKVNPLDAEDYFPPRPYYANTFRKVITQQLVTGKVALIDDFLHGKVQLPLIHGTSFNDSFVPNVIAYGLNHGYTDWKHLYSTAVKKGHTKAEVDGWFAKADQLIFLYPQFRDNIKKHYPELFDKYFKNEWVEGVNNLKYLNIQEFKGTLQEYKQKYRESEYFTVADNYTFAGTFDGVAMLREIITLGFRYNKVGDMQTPNDEYHILFFDEYDARHKKLYTDQECTTLQLSPTGIKTLKTAFYDHIIRTDGDGIIHILSEQKLQAGKYLFHGTRFTIKDNKVMGQISNVNADTVIVILHSFEQDESERLPKNLKEAYEMVPHSEDELWQWLMSKNNGLTFTYYNTSDFVRNWYLTTIFSGRDAEGRPLNLFLLGKPGSGKTPHIESISEKFFETPLQGSSSTLKGLLVSWADRKNPMKGAFYTTKRVLFIDEFLKILSLKGFNSNEDITQLNGALDNKAIPYKSGYGSITEKSTCQSWVASNPKYHWENNKELSSRMTFSEMCEKLPTDFMGRFLFLTNTEEEFKDVIQGNMIDRNFNPPMLDKKKFIALYDFFCKIHIQLTNEQTEQLMTIVSSLSFPAWYQVVYEKCMGRFAPLVLQGIVKKRMFKNKILSMQVIQADFTEFERLWTGLHNRLIDFATEQQKQDYTANKYQLNDEELQVLEAMRQSNNEMSMHTMKKYKNWKSITADLQKAGFIKPDWSNNRRWVVVTPPEQEEMTQTELTGLM